MNELSRRVNQSEDELINVMRRWQEKAYAPFTATLAKKQLQPMVTSYTAEALRVHKDESINQYADEIAELQRLALAGNTPRYEEKLKELQQAGLSCRLTKAVVYFTRQEDLTVEIEIKVQVKGHSLTWYFWAPGAMDQYPQAFRNELYDQAAVCHRGVDAGCDLYYRGSNSIHIKLMHTHEDESGHNHNHYRLRDNKPYTPNDFRQHMAGFKGCELERKYFVEGEIDKICNEFEAHYLEWTRKIDGGMSKEERYLSEPTQTLNTGDMIELYLFGAMQEPCRLSVEELKVDYQAARDAIEAQLRTAPGAGVGQKAILNQLHEVTRQYDDLLEWRRRSASRGLNSSIASARQVEGSLNPVIKARQRMDDGVGVQDPGVPEWAIRLKKAVDESKRQMLALANERYKDRVVLPKEDAASVWAEEAGYAPQDLSELIINRPQVDSGLTTSVGFFATAQEPQATPTSDGDLDKDIRTNLTNRTG
jgi:hypothetical protein